MPAGCRWAIVSTAGNRPQLPLALAPLAASLAIGEKCGCCGPVAGPGSQAVRSASWRGDHGRAVYLFILCLRPTSGAQRSLEKPQNIRPRPSFANAGKHTKKGSPASPNDAWENSPVKLRQLPLPAYTARSPIVQNDRIRSRRHEHTWPHGVGHAGARAAVALGARPSRTWSAATRPPRSRRPRPPPATCPRDRSHTPAEMSGDRSAERQARRERGQRPRGQGGVHGARRLV